MSDTNQASKTELLYQIWYCSADWESCRDADVSITSYDGIKIDPHTLVLSTEIPVDGNLLVKSIHSDEMSHWIMLKDGFVFYTLDEYLAYTAYKQAFANLQEYINHARFEYGSYMNLLQFKKDLNFPVTNFKDKYKKAE